LSNLPLIKGFSQVGTLILQHSNWISNSATSSCQRFSEKQALLDFKCWLCVSAKPNVPVCAFAILHEAQRLNKNSAISKTSTSDRT